MVNTQLVLDMYSSGLCVNEIAEKLNCSGETVRRKLRKAGYDLKKLNQKHCPAIVGIYYFVDEIKSPKQISDITGIRISTIWQILDRKYGVAKRRKTVDESTINAIEREYLAGVTTYALGEKYNLNHATISKLMIARGHVRGRGGCCSIEGLKKGHETQLRNAIKKLEDKLIRDGNNISLVEFRNKKSIFKCNTCGCVFTRARDTTGAKIWCPECKQKMLLKIRKKNGGKVFPSGRIRERCKRYGVFYDSSITKEYLIKRDKNICQICGDECDASDIRWGHTGPLAPSTDHIIPLKRGGEHTDENTQLTHLICNIVKNDKLISSEVIAHAKEQAAAYKCA